MLHYLYDNKFRILSSCDLGPQCFPPSPTQVNLAIPHTEFVVEFKIHFHIKYYTAPTQLHGSVVTAMKLTAASKSYRTGVMLFYSLQKKKKIIEVEGS